MFRFILPKFFCKTFTIVIELVETVSSKNVVCTVVA